MESQSTLPDNEWTTTGEAESKPRHPRPLAYARGVAAKTSSIVPELSIMRTRRKGEQRASFFELFFDLVYVFAVTQLSHHLLDDISWATAAETAFMPVALYWAWNCTTWMTNWFDPDTVPVRLVLVFVMAASLLMAVAIPRDSASTRSCSRAPMRACRSGGTRSWSWSRHTVASIRTSARSWLERAVGSALGGGRRRRRRRAPLGALAGSAGTRPGGSAGRLLAAAPGPTAMSQWQIEGAHFGERFQLFVIIALGESIVLAGATASDSGLSIEVVAALLLAFLSSTALWWLYFGQVAGTVWERIRMATLEERGQIGRDIYTYLHLPIVAGIVLVAVADELVIAHPEGRPRRRRRRWSPSGAPPSSSWV